MRCSGLAVGCAAAAAEPQAVRRLSESCVKLYPDRFWRSGYFIAGALVFVLGSGPLLTIIALAKLGFTKDPNPNPVGCGILAMFTFWPGLILMLVGFAKSAGRGSPPK